MRWRKLLITLRKNPNLLDPIYQLSEREAKESALRAGYKPYHEMMEGIRLKTAFSEEIWEAVEPSIKRSKLRNAIKPFLNIPASLPNQRRLVLAGLILLLLTGFFALVPAGRAFASNIFNFVIRMTEHRIIFEQPGVEQLFPSEPTHIDGILQEPIITPDDVNRTQDYSGEFEKFYDATRHGVVRLENGLFNKTHAEFGQFGMNYYINTRYRFNNTSSEISISQRWFQNPESSNPNIAADDLEYYTVVILNNVDMHCVYDNLDDIFIGIAFIGNCKITITATEGIDLDLLIDSIVI